MKEHYISPLSEWVAIVPPVTICTSLQGTGSTESYSVESEEEW